MGPEEAQRIKEKAQAGSTFFIGQDLRISDAGVGHRLPDADTPNRPAAVALALAIAGDAVTDQLETTQLFDMDVDDLAGMLAFIPAHRFGRLQCGRALVDAEPLQDAR